MSASASSLAKMARVMSPAAMATASTSTTTTSSSSSSSSSSSTLQPLPPADTHDYWNRDSTSVSAVSFGFVATAVLISLFLIVAIFERFLRRAPSSDMDLNNNSSSRDSDRGAFRPFTSSQGHSEPPFEQYPATEISVLMPGQKVPTFIANPAPMPCSLKGMLHSSHGDGTLGSCSFDHTRSTNGHPSKPENEENGTALV